MLDAIPFEAPAEIPFVIMQAEISGRPARVLLDTGNAAPYDMIVSPAAAARAGAVVEDGLEQRSGAVVGDVALRYSSARLPSFSIGAIRRADIRVAISPAVDSVSGQLNTPLDAILGHQFVAGRTISIDYGRREVDFTAEPGPAARALAFSLAPRRPLTLVHVTVNGRGPFLMVLDSGASTTLVSPATAAAAGLLAEQRVSLGGGGGAASAGARLGAARVVFGNVARDGQPVAVADVFGPIREATGAPIEGILGADMFRDGRITIDYASNRLWFEEAGRTD